MELWTLTVKNVISERTVAVVLIHILISLKKLPNGKLSAALGISFVWISKKRMKEIIIIEKVSASAGRRAFLHLFAILRRAILVIGVILFVSYRQQFFRPRS